MGAYTPAPAAPPPSFQHSPDPVLSSPAPGLVLRQKMIDAGAPENLVNQWQQGMQTKMLQAGAPPDQVDQYWGVKPAGGPSAFADAVKSNVQAVPPETASNPLEYVQAGFQSSVTGLAMRGKMPSTILPQHAGIMASILSGAGQFAGDIPATVAGFVGGAATTSEAGPLGAAAGSMAGAAALPTAMRESLMASYQAGEHETFGQAAVAAGHILVDTAKSAIEGAVAGPAGVVAGRVATAAPTIANMVTQAATTTAVAGALDGKVPNAQDFVTGAALAIGFHTAGKVVGAAQRFIPSDQGNIVKENLQDAYTHTGQPPAVIAQKAATDAVVKSELIAPTAADGTRVTPAIDRMKLPDPEVKDYSEKTTPEEEAAAKAAQAVKDNAADESHESRALTIQGDKGDYLPPEGKPPAPIEPASGGSGDGGEPPAKEYLAGPDKNPFDLNEDQLTDRVLDIVAPEIKKGGMPPWLDPRKLFASFQARLVPAQKIDQAIKLAPGQVGIEDMLRQTFASKERAGYFVRYGGLDPITLEPTKAPSWIDAFKAVKEDGGTLKGFQAYRLAKRTVEKAGQGIKTGIDYQDAQALLATKGVAAKYERGLQTLSAAKDASIDYARDSGVFSEKAADAMKSLNNAHIVMRRVMDPTYEPPLPPGRGFGVRSPVKKMEGSERKIIDPATAEIDNLHTIIAMADRNRALGSIIGLIEQKAKEGKLPEGMRITKADVIDLDTGKSLKGKWQDEQGNPLPEGEKFAAEPFLAARKANGGLGPQDFLYYRNGQAEVWHVHDPDLAEVFRAHFIGKINPVAQLMSKFASLGRAGITASPDFPFRAILHGQFAAAVAAPHGSWVPFHDVMAGIMSTIKQDDDYRAWVANGGAGSALSDMDVKYINKDVNKLFDETGTTNKVWNVVQHPIEAMRAAQHMVDAAARVGYMKRAQNAGLSSLKAATESRTAYLDHGEAFGQAWVNTWAKMVPFMPVGFKDIEQMTRAMKERPIATAMKGAVILSMPTIINYFANHLADKKLPPGQRYTDLPQWERDMYWVLPPINGVRIKIKSPYVMGFMFKTLPERFLDYLAGGNPQAFQDLASTFYGQFVPPLIPSLIAPIAEDWANKKLYNGQPMVPASLEQASDYMQYDANTTPEAKKLAQVLGSPGLGVPGMSPIAIDNYMEEWLGTLPMTALHAINQPFVPASPHDLANIPFVGAFIARHPDMSAQPIQNFYNRMADFTAAKTDVRLDTKQGLQPSLQQREQSALKLTQFQKSLTAQSALIRGISLDKNLTAIEKRQMIDPLISRMIQTAQAGLTLMDSVK